MSDESNIDPRIVNTLGCWKWRLNNLYYVVDDNGNKVLFKLRKEQEALYEGMHGKNIILKARQYGITTFFIIFYLDRTLFSPNCTCVLISHGVDPSKKIFAKVQFAYDNLVPVLKQLRPKLTSTKQEIVIDHGNGNVSTFHVVTSARSGTVNYLHISEFGKICADSTAKAKEIISGSLNAGLAMKCLTIESTGEGKSGSYYNLCMNSLKLKNQLISENDFNEDDPDFDRKINRKMNRMQYKFWFFPWYNQHLCTEPCPEDYVFEDFWIEYFNLIEIETGHPLSRDRRYWYVNKEMEQDDSMKQEYPSTIDEAFESNLEGAWYKSQFHIIDKKMQITKVPHDPKRLVLTAWDKGLKDHTAIWFYQLPENFGGMINVLNYYENTGEVLDFYVKILDELKIRHGYEYGPMWGPHDMARTDWGTGKTDIEIAQDIYGIIFNICPKLSIVEGINRARELMLRCRFDRDLCKTGIDHLRNYMKKKDGQGGFVDIPVHNIHSHGADAARTLGTSDLTIKEVSIGGNVLKGCLIS